VRDLFTKYRRVIKHILLITAGLVPGTLRAVRRTPAQPKNR
jgi:hypothetical protein